MPRGKTTKLYRTFVKGLITEAGFLTYPEDASTDELNTVIYRKGNRSRRLGIDFEHDSTAYNHTHLSNSVTTEYVWKAVGENASINFLCMQIANRIYFFDMASEPITNGSKAFYINLETYKTPTAAVNDVSTHNVHMFSGKGLLFIAQEHVEPLVAEYNEEDDTITVTPIVIQVRDFDGVNDGLANDQEPSTLSKEHHYNLMNQGWVSPGSKSTGAIPGGGTVNDEVTYYNPYTGEAVDYRRYDNEVLP